MTTKENPAEGFCLDSYRLYRIAEVAGSLGVHENTIRRWFNGGLLPARRLPSGGLVWTGKDIINFLDSLKATPWEAENGEDEDEDEKEEHS